MKDDSQAFIFTLKNPHNVPPTRFMKRQASKYAIRCNNFEGPEFFDGKYSGCDISISHTSNVHDSYITNDGTKAFGCHPVLKASLFVNTNGPNSQNNFKVSEYEVFAQQ